MSASQREIEFAFVLDAEGKRLSPTRTNNAWKLLRVKRAILLERYPMVIQLNKVIPVEELDKSEFVLGIDDGSKEVGLGIVQKGKNITKAVFKGNLLHRLDLSAKLTLRAGYRNYRRSYKRYRPARFLNRASSKAKGRLAPSIKQKKDAILRFVKKLGNWIDLDLIRLEDVLIDIRKLLNSEVKGKDYQESNRLHENLRLATLLRDDFSCYMCKIRDVRLEVHHIIPKRVKVIDSVGNLITLCKFCHVKVTGYELEYKNEFYKYTQGKYLRLDYAQHVMQGKTYLRQELSKLAPLGLTYGYETAASRKCLEIEKSHSNDALVIAGLDSSDIFCVEFLIKPLRTKIDNVVEAIKGFRYWDYVQYVKKNGDNYFGYISCLFPKTNQCSITLCNSKILKRYGIKPLKLKYRFRGIQFMMLEKV